MTTDMWYKYWEYDPATHVIATEEITAKNSVKR